MKHFVLSALSFLLAIDIAASATCLDNAPTIKALQPRTSRTYSCSPADDPGELPVKTCELICYKDNERRIRRMVHTAWIPCYDCTPEGCKECGAQSLREDYILGEDMKPVCLVVLSQTNDEEKTTKVIVLADQKQSPKTAEMVRNAQRNAAELAAWCEK